MSRYSTFGIGGKADLLAIAKTEKELIDLLKMAKNENLKFVVIGNGSNVLFSDEGFRGLIIVNKTGNYEVSGNTVYAESGVSLGLLAKKTSESGLSGLHFGVGIPGTVGGAIAGNAGALGVDISETLVTARVWNDGKIENWKNSDFDFNYRFSKVKNSNNIIILSAEFLLGQDLASDVFEQLESDKKRRARTYVGKTCGSYFKNPEGESAGKIIDELGLKGYRIDGAEISELHANVIRNVGGAKASDILALEELINTKVYKKYNFRLVPEVVKIGF